jgi:hypothetical protein
VEPINIWNENRRRKKEEEKMAGQEVGTPQRQLDNLDDEFSCRLRHCIVAKALAVPHTRPPRPVRFIVLKLSREEDGDEDFVNRPLDVDDANET